MQVAQHRRASVHFVLAVLAAVHLAASTSGPAWGVPYGAGWIDEPLQASDGSDGRTQHDWTGPVRPLPPVEPCVFEEPIEVAMRPGAGPCLLDHFDLDFLARGYYLNDPRIKWSGQECTFGAEGVLTAGFKHCSGGWESHLEGEFYLNQPFDRNVLVDTPERVSYAPNFEVETVEISKLFLSLRRGNLMFGIGKMETPFGRYRSPLYTNARLDAPFIRTEAILWRETGLLLRYDPGWLRLDAAVTNGSEDRDTNSSKALVARLGVEQPNWGIGCSAKVQDGIGSENQKCFNNHVGADFMVSWRAFTLSGEVIYDEYGFREPGFNPLDITWGRSIYFRDQNYAFMEPITGLGYYLDLGYRGTCWSVFLNYGEYDPKEIGDPRHDVTNRRGIVKVDYRISPHVDVYTVVIAETSGYIAQGNIPRKGGAVVVGFQWVY